MCMLPKSDGVEIRTNAKVESVSGAKGKTKKANVELEGGESIPCDHGELDLSSISSQ